MRTFAAHSETNKLTNLAGTKVSREEEWEIVRGTKSFQPTIWHYGDEATWSIIAFSSFEAVVLAYSSTTQISLIEWSKNKISEISHKLSEPSAGTNVDVFNAKNQFFLVSLNNSLSENR